MAVFTIAHVCLGNAITEQYQRWIFFDFKTLVERFLLRAIDGGELNIRPSHLVRRRVRLPSRHKRLRVPIPRRIKHHKYILLFLQLRVKILQRQLNHVLARIRMRVHHRVADFPIRLRPHERILQPVRARKRRARAQRTHHHRDRAP